MNINRATLEFKENIIKLVNECGLPAVNILYVIKDIESEVQNAFNDSLMEEETGDKQDGCNDN